MAEVHRIRQGMLDEFGGNADALMEDRNRRVLSGEFGEFTISTRKPQPPRWISGRDSTIGIP